MRENVFWSRSNNVLRLLDSEKIFQLQTKHEIGGALAGRGGEAHCCLMGAELKLIRSFQILFGNNLNIVNITEVSFKSSQFGSICWIF